MVDLKKYHLHSVSQMESHITHMKTLISAALLKFNLQPPCDILIEGEHYSSFLIHEILQKMATMSDDMHKLVESYQNPAELLAEGKERKKDLEKVDNSSSKKITTFVFAAAGLVMAGILLYKAKDKFLNA